MSLFGENIDASKYQLKVVKAIMDMCREISIRNYFDSVNVGIKMKDIYVYKNHGTSKDDYAEISSTLDKKYVKKKA